MDVYFPEMPSVTMGGTVFDFQCEFEMTFRFDFLIGLFFATMLLNAYGPHWCSMASEAAGGNGPQARQGRKVNQDPEAEASRYAVVILGTAQDAGFPQAGCLKDCCRVAWKDQAVRRFPTSIALIDRTNRRRWLFDCSWQLPDQLNLLNQVCPRKDSPGIDGIFLTHGHIGHYTGLMHLGREVMGAGKVRVHAMPQMAKFLKENGPWDLLVKLGNIQLIGLKADQPTSLGKPLPGKMQPTVTPIVVPHRGEYTETVGFVIKTPGKSVLYLPDIDKWSRWETKIEHVLERVDMALIDATFFRNGEIPGRDMSEIPHPFVEESLLRFQGLSAAERAKIHFIHLNHTNPALDPTSSAAEQIKKAGMNLAEQGKVYSLESTNDRQ